MKRVVYEYREEHKTPEEREAERLAAEERRDLIAKADLHWLPDGDAGDLKVETPDYIYKIAGRGEDDGDNKVWAPQRWSKDGKLYSPLASHEGNAFPLDFAKAICAEDAIREAAQKGSETSEPASEESETSDSGAADEPETSEPAPVDEPAPVNDLDDIPPRLDRRPKPPPGDEPEPAKIEEVKEAVITLINEACAKITETGALIKTLPRPQPELVEIVRSFARLFAEAMGSTRRTHPAHALRRPRARRSRPAIRSFGRIMRRLRRMAVSSALSPSRSRARSNI